MTSKKQETHTSFHISQLTLKISELEEVIDKLDYHVSWLSTHFSKLQIRVDLLEKRNQKRKII